MSPFSARQDEVLTVTRLTRRVKALLEGQIGFVQVAGEISNLRVPRSGHAYFTLKDDNAQLRAVLFRRYASSLKFDLEDGLAVVVSGEMSVYEPRGEYQLVATRLEPKGLGALQLRFEQLKENLRKEGLFDADHKKPLPFLPGRVAVVTSATGAAVRDILNVALRRFPRASVLVCPVRVQGDEAAGEIAAAIDQLNRIPDVDVIIAGRGGGSIEDLWAFNEEVVARAVFRSKLPVVSAVGHEVDFTICDFVADQRAATPTEAAELVFPRWEDLADEIDDGARRLRDGLRRSFEHHRARLDTAAARIDPRAFVRRLLEKGQRLDELSDRMGAGLGRLLARRGEQLSGMRARLEALNPRRILERGYSVTLLDTGEAVKHPSQAPAGTVLTSLLSQGEIRSVSRGDTGSA